MIDLHKSGNAKAVFSLYHLGNVAQFEMLEE